MKILFFIALLFNIVFFLWELNSGGLNSPVEITGVGSHKAKQILLVSELAEQNEGNSFKIEENKIALYDSIVSLERYSATNSKKDEATEESGLQLIKSSTTTIEEFSETLISSDELLQKDQSEQKNLQHDTDILLTNDQADSVAAIPVLEEKPLTGENQKEVVVNNGSFSSDEPSMETNDLADSVAAILVLEEKSLTRENQEKAVVNSALNSDEASIETGGQADGLAVIPVLDEKSLARDNQEKVVVNSASISDESSIETVAQIDSLPVIPVSKEKPLTAESQEEIVVDSVLKNDKSNVEQADPVDNYCYHVGPFTSRNALKVWRKLNKIDADSVNRFNKESDIVSSYLVYFPAAETYAQSIKNVQRLEQKGITDYWLFRRGELKGAISLGLFVKKSRALSLQEKLVKAGFTIEIKERYKKEQSLFAEISTKDKVLKDTVIISDKQTISECKNINDDALVRE